MSPLVEQSCTPCLGERLHDERVGSLVCRTCGTVTEFGNDDGNAEKNGVGVSGKGVRQPSLLTSAYAATAYAEKVRGDDLAALDADPEFARFVVERGGRHACRKTRRR